MKGTATERDARLREQLALGLSGDEAAYRDFLSALAPRLRAFFRRRLGALADDAEDLVQETLLAVHLQRHTYDARQPIGPWVFALARYKMVDFLRRHGRRSLATDAIDDVDGVDDALGVSDTRVGEARIDLAKLLAELPERQRTPIVCTKLEGLSVLETSQRTGQSASAVKVNVHRGLKALAAMIGRQT